MIAEILVWGFFSALGWMTANWTVDKLMPEKPKTENICSDWKEIRNSDGTSTKSRTCKTLEEK